MSRPISTHLLSNEDTMLLKDAVRRAGYEGADYDDMRLQLSTIPKDPSAYNSLNVTTEQKARVTSWAQALATMIMSICSNLESFAFAPIS